MKSDITVVITTVGRPRRLLLRRALESVWRQTLQPDAIVVVQDTERRGAAWNRQAGTDMVRTDLVAYLDDDDEMYPHHLESLREAMNDDTSLIYPWFDVAGGTDPFPHLFGCDWEVHRGQVPVTFLARVDDIRAAGGWTNFGRWEDEGELDPAGNRAGEDYQLILRMHDNLLAKIQHLPERTWLWHHDSGNSSGLPSRVDWNYRQP